MADHEPLVDLTSPCTSTNTYSLASDIIHAAVAEASRIRLDAVGAAEQMYKEIVKSAEARADQIVAEAHEQALRIMASAESRSMQRMTGGADSRPAQDALEIVRTELAAMIRQLRGDLEFDTLHCEVPVPEPSPKVPDAASGPQQIPTVQNGIHDPQTFAHASLNGPVRKLAVPGRPHPGEVDSWEPPEWMSS